MPHKHRREFTSPRGKAKVEADDAEDVDGRPRLAGLLALGFRPVPPLTPLAILHTTIEPPLGRQAKSANVCDLG